MKKIIKSIFTFLIGTIFFTAGPCESYHSCVKRCEDENKRDDKNVDCAAVCDSSDIEGLTTSTTEE